MSAEIVQDNVNLIIRRKYLESIYGHIWLELWEYSIDSKMASNIEKYENDLISEYRKYINLNIDQMKEKIVEMFKKDDKDSKAFQQRKILIEGFPWNSPNETKSIYSRFYLKRMITI